MADQGFDNRNTMWLQDATVAVATTQEAAQAKKVQRMLNLKKWTAGGVDNHLGEFNDMFSGLGVELGEKYGVDMAITIEDAKVGKRFIVSSSGQPVFFGRLFTSSTINNTGKRFWFEAQKCGYTYKGFVPAGDQTTAIIENKDPLNILEAICEDDMIGLKAGATDENSGLIQHNAHRTKFLLEMDRLTDDPAKAKGIYVNYLVDAIDAVGILGDGVTVVNNDGTLVLSYGGEQAALEVVQTKRNFGYHSGPDIRIDLAPLTLDGPSQEGMESIRKVTPTEMILKSIRRFKEQQEYWKRK